METQQLPEIQLPEIANDRIKSYIEIKDFRRRYAAYYYQQFIYEDGTSSLWVNNDESVRIGEDFRDYRGRLHIITAIVTEHPHKVDAKRKVVKVKSTIIPGV